MKIVNIDEGGIDFDNGKYLEHYHDQDCCEWVYADWKKMVMMGETEGNNVDITQYDFFENVLDSVVPIEGLGFYLVTKQGTCIRVDCYNIQSGYYSSKLELCYGDRKTMVKKDITDCTSD